MATNATSIRGVASTSRARRVEAAAVVARASPRRVTMFCDSSADVALMVTARMTEPAARTVTRTRETATSAALAKRDATSSLCSDPKSSTSPATTSSATTASLSESSCPGSRGGSGGGDWRLRGGRIGRIAGRGFPGGGKGRGEAGGGGPGGGGGSGCGEGGGAGGAIQQMSQPAPTTEPSDSKRRVPEAETTP